MLTYRVVVRKSNAGYSAFCPGLPGCLSQGQTEEEALARIRGVIREYMDDAEQLAQCEGRVVEVCIS